MTPRFRAPSWLRRQLYSCCPIVQIFWAWLTERDVPQESAVTLSGQS